jgi:hypothetical protein
MLALPSVGIEIPLVNLNTFDSVKRELNFVVCRNRRASFLNWGTSYKKKNGQNLPLPMLPPLRLSPRPVRHCHISGRINADGLIGGNYRSLNEQVIFTCGR